MFTQETVVKPEDDNIWRQFFHLPGQPAGEMSGKDKMRKKRRGQTESIKMPLLGADYFMRTAVQTLSLHTFVSLFLL